MDHIIFLIEVILVIAIAGIVISNMLWLSGKCIEPLGLAYFSKLAMYKKFKHHLEERIPEKLDNYLFLYGTSEFGYPNGSADRITMPNKIDFKPLKGVLVKVHSVVDIVTCTPMFLTILFKKKANTFVEIYNSASEGKAIIAYTRINADDGTPFSTFSIFLYSNSDFETLKIGKNDPKSLFSCAYVADFSIVHKRYLTLGKSKLMHDYMIEKENKEA